MKNETNDNTELLEVRLLRLTMKGPKEDISGGGNTMKLICIGIFSCLYYVPIHQTNTIKFYSTLAESTKLWLFESLRPFLGHSVIQNAGHNTMPTYHSRGIFPRVLLVNNI